MGKITFVCQILIVLVVCSVCICYTSGIDTTYKLEVDTQQVVSSLDYNNNLDSGTTLSFPTQYNRNSQLNYEFALTTDFNDETNYKNIENYNQKDSVYNFGNYLQNEFDNYTVTASTGVSYVLQERYLNHTNVLNFTDLHATNNFDIRTPTTLPTMFEFYMGGWAPEFSIVFVEFMSPSESNIIRLALSNGALYNYDTYNTPNKYISNVGFGWHYFKLYDFNWVSYTYKIQFDDILLENVPIAIHSSAIVQVRFATIGYGYGFVDGFNNNTNISIKQDLSSKDFSVGSNVDYLGSEYISEKSLNVETSNTALIEFNNSYTMNTETLYYTTIVNLTNVNLVELRITDIAGMVYSSLIYNIKTTQLSLNFLWDVYDNYYVANINNPVQFWLIINTITDEIYGGIRDIVVDSSLELVIPYTFSANLTSDLDFGMYFYGANVSSIVYAIDSNIQLYYVYSDLRYPFLDLGYNFNSIRERYISNQSTSYNTFDYDQGFYSITSNFTHTNEIRQVNGFNNNSLTKKQFEIYCRKIMPISGLRKEIYELDSTFMFKSNSFSIVFPFMLIANYSYEISVGAHVFGIFCNSTSSLSYWIDDIANMAQVNSPIWDNIGYFSINRSPDNNTNLFYTMQFGYTSYTKNVAFDNTTSFTKPVFSVCNYDLENPSISSLDHAIMYGFIVSQYNTEMDCFIGKSSGTFSKVSFGLTYYEPRVKIPLNIVSVSIPTTLTIPSLATNSSYYILSSKIIEVNISSVILFTYLSDIIGLIGPNEEIVASNNSYFSSNISVDDLFSYLQYNNYNIDYYSTTYFYNNYNNTVNTTLTFDVSWVLYLAHIQPTLLTLGMNMIAPFLMVLIFPYAFYSVFGKKGVPIGLLIGIIVMVIASQLTLVQGVILSFVVFLLLFIFMKKKKSESNGFE
jgi:hypothetical protein